jgi:hypothetical protein
MEFFPSFCKYFLVQTPEKVQIVYCLFSNISACFYIFYNLIADSEYVKTFEKRDPVVITMQVNEAIEVTLLKFEWFSSLLQVFMGGYTDHIHFVCHWFTASGYPPSISSNFQIKA